MSRRDPVARLLADIDPAYFGDPVAEIGMFVECKTAADARDVLRRAVAAEVDAMLKLVEDADAFDVIELIRMREFPPVPDPSLKLGGSALNVEIIAAMLLGRSPASPIPTRHAWTPARTRRSANSTTALSGSVGWLPTASRFEARISDDPLAPLAAEYQGSRPDIRNLQYDTIREAHESQLFDNAIVNPLMVEHLGYTYADVLTVRDSMRKLGGDRMTKLRDDTGDILMRHHGTAPADVPRGVMREFMAGMIPFMFLPADRAMITPEDVAADAGADVAERFAVLESFAQTFDAHPCRTTGLDLLTSGNPFQTTPLSQTVRQLRGNDQWSWPRRAPADRREGALAGTKHIPQLRQESPPSSQRTARPGIAREGAANGAEAGRVQVLRTRRQRKPLRSWHRLPRPKGVGKPVEADGLFIVGDVAICVEVKGKSMATAARRGDVKRLWSDLKATIGDGCKQAARLEALIETNAGLWLEGGTWLDLSDIRELRSIVALLDDVGPLGTSLGEHRETGLLPADRTPWVTSLHDLETIAQVCDRPSEFLLYLRRRADSDVATYYKASDELDLFMLFMNADLYVEPDPDELRAQHPTRPPVTSRDRRERARSAIPTRVGEQCQPLNAWMDRHNPEHFPVGAPPPEKPTYNALPRILELIDMIDAHGTGMIRFGADILALASDAQDSVLKLIDKCTRRSRQDAQPHDGTLSFAGAWGHPTVFIGSRPRGGELEPVRQRLESYMHLKRHQLQSDRSYGLVFGVDGNLELAMYLNNPVGENAELDALVEQFGFKPAIDDSRPFPPSARRTTRRLRGKKRQR